MGIKMLTKEVKIILLKAKTRDKKNPALRLQGRIFF
jgi:hypothetical protein